MFVVKWVMMIFVRIMVKNRLLLIMWVILKVVLFICLKVGEGCVRYMKYDELMQIELLINVISRIVCGSVWFGLWVFLLSVDSVLKFRNEYVVMVVLVMLVVKDMFGLKNGLVDSSLLGLLVVMMQCMYRLMNMMMMVSCVIINSMLKWLVIWMFRILSSEVEMMKLMIYIYCGIFGKVMLRQLVLSSQISIGMKK